MSGSVLYYGKGGCTSEVHSQLTGEASNPPTTSNNSVRRLDDGDGVSDGVSVDGV